MTQPLDPNHALLAGEVAGALVQHFPHCELEVDAEHNYTGRTLIQRPSGIWAVSVEHIQSMIVDKDNPSMTDPEHPEFGTGYA